MIADIDECDAAPCDANAECFNTVGSFQCDCSTGYSGDGFNCTSMSQCMSFKAKKSTLLTVNTCIILSQSKMCLYVTILMLYVISDIDECANATLNNCDVNAACSDTVGSFNCTCLHGYQGDGMTCSKFQ